MAESEGDLQRVVNELYSVCKRRKLKVNAGKSKVMVFRRREEEVVDFNTAYSLRGAVVSTPAYEFAGLGSYPGRGSRRTAQPAVHPFLSGWSINGYLGKPGEGKLWKSRTSFQPCVPG